MRLTDAAGRDIEGILDRTLSTFGEHQLAIHAELIDAGLRAIATDPTRASSHRFDLDPSVSSLHLTTVAQTARGGAPRHRYCVKRGEDGVEEVQILRLLHDRMDPARHLS